MRLRLVLRGFVDFEAFDAETLAGAAERFSRGVLASAAARKKQWIIVSLDIAFLKGLTCSELAATTGEKERMVCFGATARLSHRAEVPARL